MNLYPFLVALEPVLQQRYPSHWLRVDMMHGEVRLHVTSPMSESVYVGRIKVLPDGQVVGFEPWSKAPHGLVVVVTEVVNDLIIDQVAG